MTVEQEALELMADPTLNFKDAIDIAQKNRQDNIKWEEERNEREQLEMEERWERDERI